MTSQTNIPENTNSLSNTPKQTRNPRPATFETSAELAKIFGSVDAVHLEASIRMCLMRACRPEESGRVEAFVQSYMSRLAGLNTQYAAAKEEIIGETETAKEAIIASLDHAKWELFAQAQTQIALSTLALDGKARANIGQIMEGPTSAILEEATA
jgi:hypothetical protein